MEARVGKHPREWEGDWEGLDIENGGAGDDEEGSADEGRGETSSKRARVDGRVVSTGRRGRVAVKAEKGRVDGFGGGRGQKNWENEMEKTGGEGVQAPESAGPDEDGASEEENPPAPPVKAERRLPGTANNQADSDEESPPDNDIDQCHPSKQKHAPGAIIRVKMLNFVTYTKAEFKPGPSLNMVIGPNGTGKSTLVCAICLGLGWGPVHLGRAKEVGAYVKHGCKEATIEIEIQGNKKDRVNPVIKRVIYENNSTKFIINGRSGGCFVVLDGWMDGWIGG